MEKVQKVKEATINILEEEKRDGWNNPVLHLLSKWTRGGGRDLYDFTTCTWPWGNGVSTRYAAEKKVWLSQFFSKRSSLAKGTVGKKKVMHDFSTVTKMAALDRISSLSSSVLFTLTAYVFISWLHFYTAWVPEVLDDSFIKPEKAIQ